MASRPQRKDRKYKDLKANQKGRMADKTYRTYLTFYLEHNRMPDESEQTAIHQKIFQSVLALAPKAAFEEFEKICEKRVLRYEKRILTDISNGVTLESLQKKKKTPEEKAAIQKEKNALRRKRRKKRKMEAALRKQREEMYSEDQDDNFFFIAGYTSGGAPYGITWEEMGLDSNDELEELPF